MSRRFDDLLLAESRRLTTLAGRTRQIAPWLHVGALGGQRLCLPVSWLPGTDHALRADLVTRALERLGDPARRSVWLTRSGATVAGDVDLAWDAAARTALARHGIHDGVFYVVTRRGWFEVAGDAGRSWRRLRHLTSPVEPPPPEPDRWEGWRLVV